MRKVCMSTAAVLLLGMGPLLAANNASLIGIPHAAVQPNATPDTVSVGFVATGVLVGITDPEGIVPCFNCVSGPDIQTLLMAVPLGAVFSGKNVTIMVLGDDLFYGGNAIFTYSIKTSPTSAPVMSGSVGGQVSPGSWFAEFPITAPAAGMYILEGEISVGQGFGQHTKITAPLIVGRS